LEDGGVKARRQKRKKPLAIFEFDKRVGPGDRGGHTTRRAAAARWSEGALGPQV